MNNTELQEKVLEWARDKDILKPENKLMQFAKFISEAGELGDSIIKNDLLNIIDSIGDVQVTLIILCEQLGHNYDDCLESAYEVIRKRTGKTVNGTFIKSEDL